MFFLRLKNFLATAIALAVCLAFCIGVLGCQTVKLRGLQGERIFYLRSASSQGLRVTKLNLKNLLEVEGESVRFGLSAQENGEEKAQEIMQAYGAETVFIESVCGVTSYYCYTPKWGNGLVIDGRLVNLHIAISSVEAVVGTPIIFDGY